MFLHRRLLFNLSSLQSYNRYFGTIIGGNCSSIDDYNNEMEKYILKKRGIPIVKLYQEMLSNNIEPNKTTYGKLITASLLSPVAADRVLDILEDIPKEKLGIHAIDKDNLEQAKSKKTLSSFLNPDKIAEELNAKDKE